MEYFDKGAFVLGVIVGLVLIHRRKLLSLIRYRGYKHPLAVIRADRQKGAERVLVRRGDREYYTHKWFAWYPVTVFDWSANQWITCWLQTVTRRKTGYPAEWEYWID